MAGDVNIRILQQDESENLNYLPAYQDRTALLGTTFDQNPFQTVRADDGVLDGTEVAFSDNLASTELVVLSGCDTAVGSIGQVGESFNLRRAFHMAGVKAVVATLWRIPDLTSAELMGKFFDNLSDRQDQANALANAQRSMIKLLREKHGAAHPLQWAAFTLSHAEAKRNEDVESDSDVAKDDGADEFRNSIGMTLKLIPPGSFNMGSSRSPAEIAGMFPAESKRKEIFEREHPQRRVSISRPFYVSATEVTIAQFRAFVGETRYVTDSERNTEDIDLLIGTVTADEKLTWMKPGNGSVSDIDPVSMVSCKDAKAFCAWLGEREKRKVRLPTQAEWEYACRAGSETMYWNGDDPEELARVANIPNRQRTTRLDTYGQVNGQTQWMSYFAPPNLKRIIFEPSGYTSQFKPDGVSYTGLEVANATKSNRLFRCAGEKFYLEPNSMVYLAPTPELVPKQGTIDVFDNRKHEWKSVETPLGSVLIEEDGVWSPIPSLYDMSLSKESKIRIWNRRQTSARFRVKDRTISVPANTTRVVKIQSLGNSLAVDAQDGFPHVALTGQFPPNPFGLHDMHGNVWEWCDDPYYDYKNIADGVSDPEGRKTENDLHVLRGGCYM